eukprot:scaffold6342_cov206-Alexandrium_tamarense.AAC.20
MEVKTKQRIYTFSGQSWWASRVEANWWLELDGGWRVRSWDSLESIVRYDVIVWCCDSRLGYPLNISTSQPHVQKPSCVVPTATASETMCHIHDDDCDVLLDDTNRLKMTQQFGSR